MLLCNLNTDEYSEPDELVEEILRSALKEQLNGTGIEVGKVIGLSMQQLVREEGGASQGGVYAEPTPLPAGHVYSKPFPYQRQQWAVYNNNGDTFIINTALQFLCSGVIYFETEDQQHQLLIRSYKDNQENRRSRQVFLEVCEYSHSAGQVVETARIASELQPLQCLWNVHSGNSVFRKVFLDCDLPDELQPLVTFLHISASNRTASQTSNRTLTPTPSNRPPSTPTRPPSTQPSRAPTPLGDDDGDASQPQVPCTVVLKNPQFANEAAEANYDPTNLGSQPVAHDMVWVKGPEDSKFYTLNWEIRDQAATYTYEGTAMAGKKKDCDSYTIYIKGNDGGVGFKEWKHGEKCPAKGSYRVLKMEVVLTKEDQTSGSKLAVALREAHPMLHFTATSNAEILKLWMSRLAQITIENGGAMSEMKTVLTEFGRQVTLNNTDNIDQRMAYYVFANALFINGVPYDLRHANVHILASTFKNQTDDPYHRSFEEHQFPRVKLVPQAHIRWIILQLMIAQMHVAYDTQFLMAFMCLAQCFNYLYSSFSARGTCTTYNPEVRPFFTLVGPPNGGKTAMFIMMHTFFGFHGKPAAGSNTPLPMATARCMWVRDMMVCLDEIMSQGTHARPEFLAHTILLLFNSYDSSERQVSGKNSEAAQSGVSCTSNSDDCKTAQIRQRLQVMQVKAGKHRKWEDNTEPRKVLGQITVLLSCVVQDFLSCNPAGKGATPACAMDPVTQPYLDGDAIQKCRNFVMMHIVGETFDTFHRPVNHWGRTLYFALLLAYICINSPKLYDHSLYLSYEKIFVFVLKSARYDFKQSMLKEHIAFYFLDAMRQCRKDFSMDLFDRHKCLAFQNLRQRTGTDGREYVYFNLDRVVVVLINLKYLRINAQEQVEYIARLKDDVNVTFCGMDQHGVPNPDHVSPMGFNMDYKRADHPEADRFYAANQPWGLNLDIPVAFGSLASIIPDELMESLDSYSLPLEVFNGETLSDDVGEGYKTIQCDGDDAPFFEMVTEGWDPLVKMWANTAWADYGATNVIIGIDDYETNRDIADRNIQVTPMFDKMKHFHDRFSIKEVVAWFHNKQPPNGAFFMRCPFMYLRERAPSPMSLSEIGELYSSSDLSVSPLSSGFGSPLPISERSYHFKVKQCRCCGGDFPVNDDDADYCADCEVKLANLLATE